MNKIIVYLLTFLIYQNILAQDIKVGIFNNYSVKTLTFSVVKGEYNLQAGTKHITSLKEGDILYLTLLIDSISIQGMHQFYGAHDSISIFPKQEDAIFNIKPVFPAIDSRDYDEAAIFTADIGRITIINELNINKYLAGVVQAEGGPNATLEYYKAQAMLCRTYAMKNIEKHLGEGFNMCDEVHCQAYKGRNDQNNQIFQAAKLTHPKVVVAPDSTLITAVFHANCGGETQNSGDLWLVHHPYLVAVTDPYCANKANYRWEYSIPLSKWKNYLKKNGVPENVLSNNANLNFNQDNRKVNYIVGNTSIKFGEIRTDWKLRSAFFSIKVEGDNVVLNGKGYGHGIGMCQIGAMEMSARGKSVEEIIYFYYKNVEIMEYGEFRLLHQAKIAKRFQ